MDLTLLWLWCRPAAADPIQPLARELLYAVGVAVKKKKRKKESKKRKEKAVEEAVSGNLHNLLSLCFPSGQELLAAGPQDSAPYAEHL